MRRLSISHTLPGGWKADLSAGLPRACLSMNILIFFLKKKAVRLAQKGSQCLQIGGKEKCDTESSKD